MRLTPILFVLFCFTIQPLSAQEPMAQTEEDAKLLDEMKNDRAFQKFLKQNGQSFAPFALQSEDEQKEPDVFPEYVAPKNPPINWAIRLEEQLGEHEESVNQRNRDTVGYKCWKYDIYVPRMPILAETQPAKQSASVGILVDQRQGILYATEEELDFAIDGVGFFQVVDQEGGRVLYTRCGSFERDAEGFLALIQGERIFRVTPEIRIPADCFSFELLDDGTLQAASKSEPLGRLELVRFPNPKRLRPEDDRCFSATPLSGPPQKQTQGVIRKGFLERSNVREKM